MSTLRITGLRAAVAGSEILRGVDLEVNSGEVHAIMGPNGAGKSTLGKVLMGHPHYEVLGGSVKLDDRELLGLPTWQRAQAGLFFIAQDPVEVPGVPISNVIVESLVAAGTSRSGLEGDVARRLEQEAAAIGIDGLLLERGVNVDCSGGEKKRIETLQLVTLAPKIAILDEIDSGLDIDALRHISQRIEAATQPGALFSSIDAAPLSPLGVLAITHYRRLLNELHPDVVHVMIAGRIIESGGVELVEEIERSGYAAYEEKSTALNELR